MTMNSVIKIGVALAMLALTACASVQPWQRGDLARPGMAFESDPLLTTYRQHVAVSK